MQCFRGGGGAPSAACGGLDLGAPRERHLLTFVLLNMCVYVYIFVIIIIIIIYIYVYSDTYIYIERERDIDTILRSIKLK